VLVGFVILTSNLLLTSITWCMWTFGWLRSEAVWISGVYFAKHRLIWIQQNVILWYIASNKFAVILNTKIEVHTTSFLHPFQYHKSNIVILLSAMMLVTLQQMCHADVTTLLRKTSLCNSPPTMPSVLSPEKFRVIPIMVLRLGTAMDKKNQLDVTFCILYFSSNSCSTCFGQPCAHHQELTTAW
jgi:hypothetical protein